VGLGLREGMRGLQDGKGGLRGMRLLFVSGAPRLSQKGSARGPPSSRTPERGRQNSKPYFSCQAKMPASAREALKRAKRRAKSAFVFSSVVPAGFLLKATWRMIWLKRRSGVPMMLEPS